MVISDRKKTQQEVTAFVGAVWMQFPELRLGQLLSNALRSANGNTDPFYVEDAELVRIITEWAVAQEKHID